LALAAFTQARWLNGDQGWELRVLLARDAWLHPWATRRRALEDRGTQRLASGDIPERSRSRDLWHSICCSVNHVQVGPTYVKIDEVPADGREFVVNGRTLVRGQRLSSLIEQLGGYQGYVTQPMTGERFAVSLEPWRDSDSRTTWIAISFITDL
jgi:hypothetical protein